MSWVFELAPRSPTAGLVEASSEGRRHNPWGPCFFFGTRAWDVGACGCASRRTQKPNAMPALLPRGPDAQAARVRGPARLLRGGAAVARGRPRLWLLPRSLPRD